MYKHVDLGGEALLSGFFVQTPSTLTRHMAHGAWHAESTELNTRELTLALGGQVRIILLMTV